MEIERVGDAVIHGRRLLYDGGTKTLLAHPLSSAQCPASGYGTSSRFLSESGS
jgi:hypothetical protein